MSGTNRTAVQHGVSVKDIQHERAWLQTDIHSVTISMVVETRSREHAQSLRTLLEAAGYR